MNGTAPAGNQPIGTFCLVLHSHLPWLAGHGSWPVGEEWLYQAWASSYLPVFDVLRRLAGEGRRDLLTLGVTPILAAQLDSPRCLDRFHTWLGFWQARADELALNREPDLAEAGRRERTDATRALHEFDARWRHGASPVLRPLIDSGVIEYLGGPATHAFTPLLADEVASFGLRVGLDDATLRLGTRPQGIWLPECAYRPGTEEVLASSGVRHFMVDGPTLLRVGANTSDAWTVADSPVVAFGRDLDVTYRVWSPRRGYPGGAWYRDFHAFHYESGFRPYRVTSVRTPADEKALYDPERAAGAVARDADDFVAVVVNRLRDLAATRDGRPGLVVAAYDTELFGHWWHEGPQWLERILRLLPEAGVRVTTLRGAIDDGAVAGSARLEAGSWGSKKDFRVWDGPATVDLVADNDRLQRRLLALTTEGSMVNPSGRDPARDQAARSALLALASDWAFMVTKDSAAGYARDRHAGHHRDFDLIASALSNGDDEGRRRVMAVAGRVRTVDNPFAFLDARDLANPRRTPDPTPRPTAHDVATTLD